MATECTQESVLDFLIENGGRVKNKDLIEHFKVFLSGGNTERTLLKERFKRFVDNIAYVKQENGQKVVCLKKKYRYPEMRTREDDGDEGIYRGMHALQFEENGNVNEEINGKHNNQKSKVMDVKLDAVSDDKTIASECISDIALIEKSDSSSSHRSLSDVSNITGEMAQENGNDIKSIVLELSNSQSTGKLESRAEELEPIKATQVVIRRRTSRGSQRSLFTSSEEEPHDGPCDGTDGSTPKGSRKNFLELMMSRSPQVRHSLVHRISSRNSDFMMSSMDEDCGLVTLDPLEHEWMMCTADGEWDSLQRLLMCEPTLISKKDFVTGFTCLHWAAKQGQHELFAMLVSFARQHNVAININARSSAGYTPLHLAAMHNHIEVMKLLVGAYDADVDIRDYSGKKASQYLQANVTGDIKDIIGACGSSDTENAPEAGRWRLPKVLPSNLNPLRLLNHPEEVAGDGQVKPRALYRKSSIGRIRLQRNRFKTQIVHSTSFRENEEGDDSLKSPVKSRPMSNLFG
ncbi:ankyrin repeat domain-containing protein SOWAHC-like [Myxocyprinus asiaticus]|uniref:ankyrin repeat domain-containing protein SOWAHC-like n=1 Tax=Myxocyprinus asiaticus TaxID=70543 RepID=UPI002222E1EF|nr:ankyrin repeat domain-containing protein SOWAHC-like [Myxocyprinus asiaticus]